MTVSNIGSTTNTYQAASPDRFTQLFQDFKSIGSAVQSGDLATAQTALTTFQNDLQASPGKNPISQLFNNNSMLTNDLTALQTALKSNDPASAKTAFKNLMQDMQGAMKAHKGHHHHHRRVDNDGDQNDQGSTSGTSPVDVPAPSTASSTSLGGTLDVQA